jgi:hypothetical protein
MGVDSRLSDHLRFTHTLDEIVKKYENPGKPDYMKSYARFMDRLVGKYKIYKEWKAKGVK